jgi:Flp pilus assembly protein TadD
LRGLGRARDEAAAWEDYLRLASLPDAACPALGLAYARAGDPIRAIEAYERCAAAAPDDPERWLDLAVEYQARGRSSEATEAFRRAAALDPSDPRIPQAVSRSVAGEDAATLGVGNRATAPVATGAAQ